MNLSTWLTRYRLGESVSSRGGGSRGLDCEFGAGRYKLLHLEWINNKVLMSSTGNYNQYLLINHNGNEDKKECLHGYN